MLKDRIANLTSYIASPAGFFLTTSVFVLGHALDAVVTHHSFQLGFDYESNHLMHQIITQHGWDAFYAVKLGAPALISIAGYKYLPARFATAIVSPITLIPSAMAMIGNYLIQ